MFKLLDGLHFWFCSAKVDKFLADYYEEKRMKFLKTSILVIMAFLLTSQVYAIETDKVKLNGNMTVDYLTLPPTADSFLEAFSKGMLYGRLRVNTFYYDWDKGIDGKQMDNRAMGIGGSLIFKSAPFKGFSGTLGLYTTQNPEFFREDKEDVGLVKSGKDTFSRDEVKNGGGYDGHFGMTVLGQAYLQYDVSKTSFVAGRQLFESVFTKSNDTKMVPNAFDGITAEIKELPGTKIQLAYFTAQKLRDHIHSHDVIAFDSWNENDDSAVNKSLTTELIGTDNELIIGTINNKSLKNVNATASYLIVPDVVSDLALEAHYKIPVGRWSVIPGARFMVQMDELDADTAVANLKGKVDGYDDPNDLDGKLYAARIDVKNGPFGMRLGYSNVSDDADLITPWRGFPTAGFTRAMAQYNWYANTEAYMIRFDYNFDKAGLVPGFRVMGRYVIQDFDDKKPGVQADSNVIHVDMYKTLAQNLEMKFRLGFVDADSGTVDMNGAKKTDVSYNEYRLELNYFF